MFPDGESFYLDIQDGIRGYNTSTARGADTFNPFKSGLLGLNLIDSHSENTDANGNNDFYFTPQKAGIYTFIVLAQGNNSNSAIYNNNQPSEIFLSIQSYPVHVILASLRLKTTDRIHMYIHNEGGSAGHYRRYWIYS